ncbi:MAG: hypothetical protein A2231_11190 [Candidatus Firestonebacteria bacterium RIFOXYA2_FULL_40_8]|nr:MAG: hypothetical protein A2231_11190 [Candidatus Firestonebacteria bacterium RIFOXYA2_FULL_40_8]
MVKKLIGYLWVLMIIIFLPVLGQAQTISIVLQDVNGADYATWTIAPPVALNTATTMTSTDGINVVIDSRHKIDLSAAVTSIGPWTAGVTPGLNIYKLEMKAFAVPQSVPALENDTTVILKNINQFDTKIKEKNRWVYVKLTTPTATTSGQPQILTVTITATVN